MAMFFLLWQTSNIRFIKVSLLNLLSTVIAVFILADFNKILSKNINEIDSSQILILSMLILTAFIAHFFFDNSLNQLVQKAVSMLRISLCQQLLEWPIKKVDALGNAAIQTTISNDIQAILSGLQVLPAFSMCLTFSIACGIYLAILSWQTTFLLFTVIIITIFLYKKINEQGRRYLKSARNAQHQFYKYFEGILFGNKELKQHKIRRDLFLKNYINVPILNHAEQSEKALNFFSLMYSLSRTFIFFSIIIIICAPIFLPLTSQRIHEFVLVYIFTTRNLMGLLSLSGTLSCSILTLSSLKELGFNTTSHVKQNSFVHEVCASSFTKIELNNVSYHYSNHLPLSPFLLGPINFTLAPGEINFIIGENGSGKSTLIKLLIGLYEPTSGYISLNDEIIHSNFLDSYRQCFSCIHEKFYLFEQIIGIKNLKQETINMILKKLDLDKKVTIEGGVLSTTKLSQGQCKRLALLYLYLDNRPIYVFDEWASDQDPEFKHIFYTKLLPEMKKANKCVVLITHDNQYFDVADNIYHLQNGLLRRLKCFSFQMQPTASPV